MIQITIFDLLDRHIKSLTCNLEICLVATEDKSISYIV